MKGHKIAIKALSIFALLLFSFIVPALIVPAVEQSYELTEFSLDLLRSTLAALPSFLGLLLLFLYHNSDTIFVLWNRTWLWLSNSTVSWSLSVEYRDGVKSQTIGSIFQTILRVYSDAETIKNDPLEKLINLPVRLGGMVQLKYFESTNNEELIDDSSLLLLRVFDLNIPFRKSEKALDELDELLTQVVEQKLRTRDAKYTFRINFVDGNPYYGMYLQKRRVLPNDIKSFNCGFIDRQGQAEGRVEVDKKKLSLVTHSAREFRRLSKRYVSLASPDASAS